ncbi:TetR/AcrR family transcriptional regulator [Flavobacterium psychrotolerans]|uniref:TetR family transcriptional regulator n=1 Tax=Flavobacterium psychrotolerans TaxID=2169410 RepID=A0A2U1JGU7_9FLAO|nr:TetR family transcriptional regulator [Flavobacterium psychrotolerans]PWA04337.1 TetR family transcriptional regulator [Flavobacterium psychrotolerans]
MNDFNDKQIQILQVAERLFAEKGFDGTSIRNISKEAKINIAMVSYYFGSKEKLLERLILFRTSDLKMKLENLFKENLKPLEKMDRFIELYIERIDQNRDLYQILHFEISSNKRAMDLKAFTDIKKGNLLSLKKIIEEGQDQDIFKKDINIPLLTPTILGTYFHFHSNKPFFKEILDLNTEEQYNHYIKNDLTKHIQQTIKSLIVYAN